MTLQAQVSSRGSGAGRMYRQIRRAVGRPVEARRRAGSAALPPSGARMEQEAWEAERFRLILAHLLVGDVWRPETRGMLYELAARAQKAHPADWERRFGAAYARARDGLAPGDLSTTAAEEHAMIDRLCRYLGEVSTLGPLESARYHQQQGRG